MKKLLFLAVCLLVQPVLAQDAALYEQVPEGSAYVRFMNAGSTSAEFTLNGDLQTPLETGTFSDYQPVARNSIAVELADSRLEKDIAESKFYTVIAVPGSADLIFLEDQKLINTMKSVIHFYNLTDRLTLSLKANSGKAEITMANQNDTGAREINPISVKLAVYEGDEKIGDVPDVILERGRAAVVAAYGSGDEINIVSGTSGISMKP